MSLLRSNRWRLALLPFLLAASLLLPILHLHPVYDHDHGEHSHKRAIIHADFFSTSADDHDHATPHDDAAPGLSGLASYSQSGLSSLTGRGGASMLPGLESVAQLVVVDQAIVRTRLGPFTHVLTQPHPPPGTEVLLSPSSPRSPPSVA